LDICIFKVSKLKTQTLFFLWRLSTHICSGSSVVANVRAVYYIPIYADLIKTDLSLFGGEGLLP
jgi:hypothetical protein